MNVRGTDFVCYQTNDIERAVAFYRDTVGLELYGFYAEVKWAEFNAGNTTFAINDPTSFDPNAKAQIGGAAIAFSVEDLGAAVKELEEKGVSISVSANESPVCHFACAQDPDGNTFWLHQRKDGTFGN